MKRPLVLPHVNCSFDSGPRKTHSAAGEEARKESLLPVPGPQLHSGQFREECVKAILECRQKLEELGHAGGAEAICSVLRDLDTLFVDQVLLAKTEIGKLVTSLQKHPEEAVSQQAKLVSDRWRKDVRTRNQVVEGFMEKSGNRLDKRMAKQLEEGVFNHSTPLGILEGEHQREYLRHYKRLCSHLKSKGRGSLLLRLEAGKLAPRLVAALPDEDLLDDERKAKLRAERLEGLKAAVLGGSDYCGTATEAYRCPKGCGHRCAYKEVQTGWHSDQQDLTILVQCLDCGERWKESDDHGLAA
eukprot:TRINITY_DN50859_c0_g2_i1.p1 TRINITY_DN50859_c0_g2~~TRINITY_DN50859_c0_g2_i1.p1  ORF type:complete len:300 (-),score=70.44 TRINITY_DN50859_c0_g2_i1:75-974(-)